MFYRSPCLGVSFISLAFLVFFFFYPAPPYPPFYNSRFVSLAKGLPASFQPPTHTGTEEQRMAVEHVC